MTAIEFGDKRGRERETKNRNTNFTWARIVIGKFPCNVNGKININLHVSSNQ